MLMVCDSTEVKSSIAEAPDVIVVAGFLIDRSALSGLLREVEEVKTKHTGNSSTPIKWNLRSGELERALKLHNLESTGANLLKDTVSFPVRRDMLRALTSSGAQLFASILQSHSNRRTILGRLKPYLVSYSFGNFLQRTSRYVKSGGGTKSIDVLLDWPDKSDRQVFVAEYLAGWRDGVCGGSKYESGPLSTLGYLAGPSFGVTDIDPRLQLADLVVGATRSFVKLALGQAKEGEFGVQQFKDILPAFARSPSKQLNGWGITVAPASSPFSAAIFGQLKKMVSP